MSKEGEGRCCVTVSTLTLTCGEGIVIWRNGLGGGEAERLGRDDRRRGLRAW